MKNGPRKLTRDEELSNLDVAYKKTVDDFVTMETTNQHARGIIGEEMNKISKNYIKVCISVRLHWGTENKGKGRNPRKFN
ncbi:MAG: hypothetical protein ACLVCH_02685 [Roseburia inulinivorans]